MGYFLDSLQNLQGALGAGLDPTQGLSFLDGLRAEQAARQEQRQSQKMQQMTMGAMGAGIPLDYLSDQASAFTNVTGAAPNPGFLAGIAQSYQPGAAAPDLREEIFADISEAQTNGVPLDVAYQRIAGKMQAIYPESPELPALVDQMLRTAYEGQGAFVVPRFDG